jgi:hypothetical protein
MLFLMLAVFTLGSSGFSVNDQEGTNCDEYAAHQSMNTLERTGNEQWAFWSYVGHFNACMDAGGYSKMEVTIIAN